MSAPLRDAAWLLQHARHCLDFYARPECVAPDGGLYHCYRDDGSVYDERTRHLVSSTRLVFQFAQACVRFPADADTLWRPRLAACLDYVRRVHRVPATGGYAWTVGPAEGERDGTLGRRIVPP